MFRRLNQLAELHWYETTDYHILRISEAVPGDTSPDYVAAMLLPMMLWIMSLMEERSLMMSRRYAAMDPN